MFKYQQLSGPSALPPGALDALVVGIAVGVVLTLLEGNPKLRRFVPSPTGIGIGMLVPGSAVFAMFVGGVIAELWRRVAPASQERHLVPLSSGFIAGEAIVAVLIPILVVLHVVKLQ